MHRLGASRGRVPLLSGGGWVPSPPDAGTVIPAAVDPAAAVPAAAVPAGPDDAAGVVESSPSDDGRRVPRRAALVALALSLAVTAGMAGRTVLSDVGAPAVPAARGGTGTAAATRAPSSPAGTGAARTSGVVLPGSEPAGSAAVVVVDVVGKVRRAGLVRLPTGSRVADAVAAAGGLAPGAAVQRINLARRLVDGEQLLVPGPQDALPQGPADRGADDGAAAQGGRPATVDLNSATTAQLDALPGVGPVTAQRIVAWRTQHQRFSRVEELGEVDGIGPKMLERLKPLVHV